MLAIRGATQTDIPAIEGLLLASGLPVGGARGSIGNFFVAEVDEKLAGVGGFERCGEYLGILRSFAVTPEHRKRGIAKEIYEKVVIAARHLGISRLYLLTATAEGYFARLGFEVIPRERAPEGVRATELFRELCPDSAVLMSRPVAFGCSAVMMRASSAEDPGSISKALFDSGYYCAEAVLMAVAKHNGIESPLIPAIASGFCSGVSRTSGMCGALTGGILGLNLLYGRERESESVEHNYRMVQRLLSEFEGAYGSTNCRDLLGCDLGTAEGQKRFRDDKLHERCREYTGTATQIAVALSGAALSAKP